MVPLDQLNEGEQGEIIEIVDGFCKKHKHGHDHGHGHKHAHHLHKIKKKFLLGGHMGHHIRISDMGLRVGKKIELLQKGKQGPLLIKVDESRIAVGRGMAEKIIIKSIE